MNAPLPIWGRSVVAAVALGICSLAPAWATDVAETAPKRISAEEYARLPPVSSEEARDLFALWNQCRPIGFELRFSDNHAKKIGLTRTSIETMVRNRLQAARIYTGKPESSNGRLEIGATVGDKTNPAFSYLVLFVKRMKDEETGLSLASAATWLKEGFGPHRNEGVFVLAHISQTVDEFIIDYLRVNESACSR